MNGPNGELDKCVEDLPWSISPPEERDERLRSHIKQLEREINRLRSMVYKVLTIAKYHQHGVGGNVLVSADMAFDQPDNGIGAMCEPEEAGKEHF